AELRNMPDAELRERLAELQKQFLEVDGPPDAGKRRAMWAELAELHAALDFSADAAWCWLNMLWFSDRPPPEYMHRWLQVEQGGGHGARDRAWLDGLLAEPIPQADELRALAARLVASLYLSPHPLVRERAEELAHYLERYETWLPVRAAWLARLA